MRLVDPTMVLQPGAYLAWVDQLGSSRWPSSSDQRASRADVPRPTRPAKGCVGVALQIERRGQERPSARHAGHVLETEVAQERHVHPEDTPILVAAAGWVHHRSQWERASCERSGRVTYEATSCRASARLIEATLSGVAGTR